jgi:hypothetical protein
MPDATSDAKAISVRTYIATAALQGLLANSEHGKLSDLAEDEGDIWMPDDLAKVAVMCADALIERLNK